jgi:Flp pilus assembly pilin Flp
MFRHIAKDEAGVSAPEYAILLLLLVASVVFAVGALNNATTSVFDSGERQRSQCRIDIGNECFIVCGNEPTLVINRFIPAINEGRAWPLGWSARPGKEARRHYQRKAVRPRTKQMR